MEKNNALMPMKYFIFGQCLILAGVIAVLFWIMASSHRERGLDALRSKVEASASLMASQLKVNQVPLSAGSAEQGTFIISQSDGTMVIDRHGDSDNEKKLWERYRTKLVYEMQKQKHGWIFYPDKTPWDFNQRQRMIRYVSIDELNWILAIEVEKPSELQLMMGSMGAGSYFGILFVLLLGAGCLWYLTKSYFDFIRRQMASEVEDNFMGLSGEDKGWEKPKDKTEIKFELPKHQVPVQEPVKEMFKESQAVHVDEAEEFLVKKPVVKKAVIEEKRTKKTLPEESGSDPLMINVGNIKSPALKKMLEQFRSK